MAVIHGTTGGISFWAFGLYIQPLENEFDWSRAQVTLGFSASLLASGVLAPLIGRWVDRYGPRRVLLIGAVGSAITFLGLAFTANLWQWYLLWTLNGIARTMVHVIPPAALITRWFQRRRGLAMGVLASGFGVGGFTIVPLLRVVIDWVDWEGAFVFSAILALLLYVPITLLVVHNEPRTAEEAAFDRIEMDVEGGESEGISAAAAVRTRLFWLITISVSALYFVIFGWLVHLVPYLESVGVSSAGAVTIVSIGAAFGVFTRLLFGLTVDRLRKVEALTMGLAVFLLASLVSLWVSEGAFVGIALFTLFWAIGTGGGPVIDTLLVASAFGRKHFATILGLIALAWSVGLVTSPAIVAVIFDRTGSYDGALIMLMVVLIVAFAGFALTARVRRPQFGAAAERCSPPARGAAASPREDAHGA